MSTLKVPGAQLSYQVTGNGPLLILIPGAKGEGEVFRQVAHDLSARYQGVTYDRLGSVDRQVIERSMAKQANEYTMANAAYWMEHELRQYPRVELDLDALAAHARQLVPACGRDSQDQMTYQPNKVLARQLGLDIVDLPGGHLGFMSSPIEFAKELMNALKDDLI